MIIIFILIIIFYNSPSTKKGWLLTLSGSTESVKPCVKAFIGLTGEKRDGHEFCEGFHFMKALSFVKAFIGLTEGTRGGSEF